MGSIFKKVYVLVLIALLSAVAMGFGCRHMNKGPLEPTLVEGPIDWGNTEKVSDSIGATPVEVGIHNIDLIFTSRMNAKTVDVVVTDESGDEVPFVVQAWSADRYVLHLKGPFKFCHQYDILLPPGAKTMYGTALEEELILSITTGKNPLDVDNTAACTADYAISPVFTDGPDVFLLTGDSITSGGILEVRRPQDLAGPYVFYTNRSNYYDDGDRIIVLPGAGTDGAAGLAKLFIDNGTSTKKYELDLWGTYDPVSESFTSSITYSHLQNSTQLLRGPFDAGDLNGDGERDVMMTKEITNIGGSVLQNVFVIKGQFAQGSNLPLVSQAAVNIIVGSTGEALTPFVSVGDLNGDGKDDLAAIRSFASGTGGWEVWVPYGNADMTKIFDTKEMGILYSYPLATIVDISADDVNGDGRSDLLVAEVEKKYFAGRYWNYKPRVSVLFNPPDKNGTSMLSADSKVSVYTAYNDAYVSVSGLGDINGDGYDDMAMLVTQKDASGRLLSSKIYVFTGRSQWYDSYPIEPSRYTSATIDVKGYGEVHFKDDLYSPKIGDVNNDGYYDFAIVGDDGTTRTVYIFFGKNSYSLVGTKMTLDDADVIWAFTP